VRAFRHPERYGPRAYDPNTDGPEGEGQTRALGIARAVLDTFPVIKWGRNSNTPQSPRGYTESKMSQRMTTETTPLVLLKAREAAKVPNRSRTVTIDRSVQMVPGFQELSAIVARGEKSRIRNC
jgi:hypothetical protein